MIRNLKEATNALLAHVVYDRKDRAYTLDNIRALLVQLGSPQDSVRVVHIAGTSGKTSTAYFIRGLLQAAGKRTGLTISPHMTEINERVQINGVPLAEDRFLAYLNQFMPLVAKTNIQLSYFEVVIAFAYWVFAKEKVDYAVIETGLGGLLDATNTVTRADKLCVITDIGLDHTEILGDTVAKIATQKAGIIQSGNVVVTNSQPPEIMGVFKEAVTKQHGSLHLAAPVKNALLPPFQERNWSLALAAYELLDLRKLHTPELAKVATQTPPGRMEVYTYRDQTIILDGAHNGQKMQAFHQALVARGIKKAAVLANPADAPETKLTDMLTAMQPFTTHLIIPEFIVGQDFYNRRSVPAKKFAQLARDAGIASTEPIPDAATALQKLLARPEKTLIVTGSLYLVSAVRSLVRQATSANNR